MERLEKLDRSYWIAVALTVPKKQEVRCDLHWPNSLFNSWTQMREGEISVRSVLRQYYSVGLIWDWFNLKSCNRSLHVAWRMIGGGAAALISESI